MAADASGVPGALFDPTASNALGGMCTGIGYGINGVYGPPIPAGLDVGDKVTIAVIGGASASYPAAQAVGYPGLVGGLSVATSPVAAGGTMPDGSTNLTGKSVPTGAGVYGVLTGPPPDTDMAAWAAAVVTNGGTVSPATKTAVDTFCKAAKANGYWSKLLRLNLFCGDQLAAALVPVKPGPGNATDTNVGFVAADYTEAAGLKGNGASKYLRTGFAPSTSSTLQNTHLAVYNRIAAANTGTPVHIGVRVFANYFEFMAPAANVAISRQYDDATGRANGTVGAPPYGLLIASRTSSNFLGIYRNGALVYSNGGSTSTTIPAGDIWVFAENNNGAMALPTADTLAAYSIGAGLTPADVTAYTADMQAFQQALGRAVGVAADADVAAWMVRVQAPGTAIVSTATQNAVQTFVTAAKAAGYWSKLQRINLFCGDFNASLIPLKNSGNAAESNQSFASSDYAENVGLTGNALNKMLGTGWAPNFVSANDIHIAVYSKATTGTNAGYTIGANSGANSCRFRFPDATGVAWSEIYNNTAGQGQLQGALPLPTAAGFGVATRTAANVHKIFRNGALLTNNATAGGATFPDAFFVFANNNGGSGPNNYSGHTLCAYSLGAGLTDAQVASYYAHMQAFQTALGRAV